MCKLNSGLGDAIEYAVEHLPPDWHVELHIEARAAWVRLEAPTGEGVAFDAKDRTLAMKIRAATDLAQERDTSPF